MTQLRLEYIDPTELPDNPANFRQHPERQIKALSGLIDEVGFAGALLYNETTGRLIDGHARKGVAAGQKVPVLIGSWTEEQEKLILASFDHITSLAGTDQAKLDDLLTELSCQNADVQALLDELSSITDEMLLDEGKEYDESCADHVKTVTCPSCGEIIPV